MLEKFLISARANGGLVFCYVEFCKLLVALGSLFRVNCVWILRRFKNLCFSLLLCFEFL